jgi:hypothetical protein
MLGAHAGEGFGADDNSSQRVDQSHPDTWYFPSSRLGPPGTVFGPEKYSLL